MKRVLFTTAVTAVAISGAVFAEGQQAASDSNLDIYLGGQAGAEFLTVAKDSTINVLFNGGSRLFKQSKNASSAIGFDGGVYAGIAQRFGKWSLGAELNADYLSGRSDIRNADGVTTAATGATAHEQFNYIYGASLLPGMYIAPNNKVYTRIGVVGGQFETNANGFMSDLAYSKDASSSGKLKKQLVGYRLGLGFESMFTPNWSLRAEYDFSQFSHLNTDQTLSYSTLPSDEQLNSRIQFKPYMNTIILGVSYHFIPQDSAEY